MTTLRRQGTPRIASAHRPRIQPYISRELHDRFSEYCVTKNQTESAVVQAALTQYLDETRDGRLLLRALGRLERSQARIQRDLELLSQAFGLFVQFWFAQAPTVADNQKEVARRVSASRFKGFMEHLAEQFSSGRRFLDDLPKEILGDDRELEAIATNPDNASSDKEPSS